MAKKKSSRAVEERGVHAASSSDPAPVGARPSALVDTGVIYCGDSKEQLQKLPDAFVELSYIDPPFNSNRNYEVFCGETKEKRAFEDRHFANPVLCSSFL